ncbi:hypothetical protein OIU77_019092 [Salix suchowensis]|uniref:Uncharacterized protein n=1 Tax=Salix suchowensis TaxID=1278906 RepID=A0ABQ9CI57_9ROSI|nr:PHD finger protein [Salix suchowensis]KAJ6398217.1 hypothetical protein OIU77_019092 [Salix suchowensis]
MEANICDINHLDADVLLPPRKRLLAGFKKQNSDGDGASRPPIVASSSSSASPPSPSPPSPPSPTPCSPSSEFQTRLNNLLCSRLNISHSLSPEQVVEASQSAAEAAVKAAEAARAAAQEKAIIAAKAVSAARSALALVASFPEEAASKDKFLKKNKLKKHVQVQLLYKKHQPVENFRDDEKLARKLHRVMNSSPRISKNSSSSDLKGGHRNKKLKSSPSSERTRVSNGNTMFGENPPLFCNGHAIAGELDSDDSIQEARPSIPDEKALKYEKTGHLDIDNWEAESSHSKEKNRGDPGSPSKKRGRLKLKKLPLSICNSKDQSNPKEGSLPKTLPLNDKTMGNPTTRSKHLFPMEPSSGTLAQIEPTPMWKCQEFKAPACIKQNKVVQS